MAVADVAVKQEPIDAVDLENRIIELCKSVPKGLSDQMLVDEMPGIAPQQRVTAINRLLSQVRNHVPNLSRIISYTYLATSG